MATFRRLLHRWYLDMSLETRDFLLGAGNRPRERCDKVKVPAAR